MNKIFICGDSNIDSASTEHNKIANPKNFASIAMNYFNLDFECHAKYGASNDRIIRKTNNWISQQNSDDSLTVLIGWSTWEREEWSYNKKFVNVDNFSLNDIPLELTSRYNEWLRIASSAEYMDVMAKKWEQKIYNYINELYSKNIKFLMWNSYIPLEFSTSPIINSKYYIDPYNSDATMFWYLKRVKQYNTILDDPYHFDDNGHKLWADFLIKYIETNNIL